MGKTRRLAWWLLAAAFAGCIGGPVTRPDPSAFTPSATPAVTGSPVTTSTPAPTPTLIPQPPGVAPVSFSRVDLSRGSGSGVTGRPLRLDASGLVSGTYDDPFGARGIQVETAAWTSEWTPVAFAFDELIASWNAETPVGTWVRVEMQARGSGRETKFYTMMVWASGDEDIHRTSVPGQRDADGDVNIDTFIRARDARALDGYRLRVTLYRRAGSERTPLVRGLSAMTSAAFDHQVPTRFDGKTADVRVPMLSQEVHAGHFPEFDGGGEAWCSPTSTAMVLGFHGAGPSDNEVKAFPGDEHDDAQVDHAARYTYDWNYKGAGNWAANIAYATRYGMDGFVTRLRSLNEAQPFLEASIPLIASVNGVLPGFLLSSTTGHLLVIRGINATGDVITNDPAARTNAEVHKTYRRADFERVWLGGSGGVVYVIHPAGKALPPNVPGLPPNW